MPRKSKGRTSPKVQTHLHLIQQLNQRKRVPLPASCEEALQYSKHPQAVDGKNSGGDSGDTTSSSTHAKSVGVATSTSKQAAVDQKTDDHTVNSNNNH